MIFSVEGWLGLVWYFGGCVVHSKPRVWARGWCFLSPISAIKSWVWKNISYGGGFSIQSSNTCSSLTVVKNSAWKDVAAQMWRRFFSITWIVKCSVWKGVIVCLFRMIVKERFMLWRVEECKIWYRVYISNSNSDSNSTSSNVIVPLQYELWRVQCEKVVWGWYHRPRVTFQLSTSIWHLSKGSRSLNIGK